MSSIYKRPQSKYWWIKWRDADGVLRRRSLRTTHHRTALARQNAIDKDRRRSPAPSCLEDHAQTYLRQLQGRVTRKHYNNVAGRLRRYLGGICSIDDITEPHIQAFITELSTAGLAARTVRGHLVALSGFCDYLAHHGMLLFNPCRGRKLPIAHSTPPRYLNDHDYAKALRIARAVGILLPVLVALKTGMRMSEIRRMRWEDISWRRDGRNLIVIPTDKGGRGRTIPMHPTLARRLGRIRQRTGWVFPGARGGLYGEKQWRELLKPLQAQIPAFQANHRGAGTAWHMFRHTFGYRMAARGVPIPILKEILGHKDIKTTMIYARLSPDVWYDDIRKA